MKFFKLILNLRKYLFTNIIAVWLYYFVYQIYRLVKPVLIDNEPVYTDLLFVDVLVVCFCFFLLGCFILLAIVEILLRKFVIEKHFPNLKLNIKFKIPKFIMYIYNFIFSVSFILSNVLFILAIIFVIYRNIYS